MANASFQFLSPNTLWLLVLLWGYLFWWSSGDRSASKHRSIADVEVDNHFYHPLAHQLIQQKALKAQKKTHPSVRKNLSFWWQGLVLSLLVLALAQPVSIGERLPDPPPQRDIVFLVDTSVSMQLKDYDVQGEAISRMQLLRNLLDEFARNMQGERIAVIVFGEEPFMLVPLTHDQHLIRRMLGNVTTTLAGRYSAVGDALLMALSSTRVSTVRDSTEKKLTQARLSDEENHFDRHRTFILFTDAHESAGHVTPSSAASLVAEQHIPVFTVAIGSSMSANEQQEKHIQGGLYQPVNHALLEDISRQTNGVSYRVNDSKAMQQALQDISKQRQNLAVPIPRYEQTALYLYPLLLALSLLIVLQLVRLWGLYSDHDDANKQGGTHV